MAQSKEVRGVATNVRTERGWTHVRYHGTDVVSFNADEIVLRTGGWRTATTKLRMNQAANQYGLGVQVYQENHEWFLRYYDPSTGDTLAEGLRFGGPSGYDEHHVDRLNRAA